MSGSGMSGSGMSGSGMSGDASVGDARQGHGEVPQDVRQVVAWLRSQPAGVLAWGDDHRILHPLARGASWVDVVVPELAAELQWGWVWTIVRPDDEDAGQAWPAGASLTIALEPDCRIYAAYDPAVYWYCEDGPVLVVGLDEDPDPRRLAELEAHAAGLGGSVECIAGWRQETLSRILERWAGDMAGRDDLVFRFDRDIMSERLRAFQDVDWDAMETFDLGDGVRASGPAMDQLLAAGPDTASEITSAFKRMLGRGSQSGGPGVSRD